MSRLKKNPSKAGVSAASVKGNAGPSQEADLGGKKTSQNQQYRKEEHKLNNQQMNMPPEVISVKDSLYLEDMLNWNLIAMKKAHFMAEHCQDQTLKQELNQVGQMHHQHYTQILQHLGSSGQGQSTGFMQ